MPIKSMFNIGGLTLTIMCEDDSYSQGDQICGKVILRGGEYQQQARSVRFRLREFWQQSDSKGNTRTVYENHKTVILANATTFEPRSETAFDFSVQLPPNCRLSPQDGSGCQIAVNVDIPAAVDPEADLTLSIRPSKEMIAFIDAIMEKLRFKRDRPWDWNDNTTRQRLLPPTALQSELDYIRFEMRNTGNGLAIEAVFDLQEKSVEDYFKAIFNQDQTRRKFILT